MLSEKFQFIVDSVHMNEGDYVCRHPSSAWRNHEIVFVYISITALGFANLTLAVMRQYTVLYLGSVNDTLHWKRF